MQLCSELEKPSCFNILPRIWLLVRWVLSYCAHSCWLQVVEPRYISFWTTCIADFPYRCSIFDQMLSSQGHVRAPKRYRMVSAIKFTMIRFLTHVSLYVVAPETNMAHPKAPFSMENFLMQTCTAKPWLMPLCSELEKPSCFNNSPKIWHLAGWLLSLGAYSSDFTNQLSDAVFRYANLQGVISRKADAVRVKRPPSWKYFYSTSK